MYIEYTAKTALEDQQANIENGDKSTIFWVWGVGHDETNCFYRDGSKLEVFHGDDGISISAYLWDEQHEDYDDALIGSLFIPEDRVSDLDREMFPVDEYYAELMAS